MSIDPLFELLARVGTALYSPDALTRQDADAVYDDVCDLVAEVTRLRGERAAVVAWLRAAPTTRMWQQAPMDDAADCIERGEHRTQVDK